mgnify:FL=1
MPNTKTLSSAWCGTCQRRIEKPVFTTASQSELSVWWKMALSKEDVRVLLRHYFKKGLNASATAREICAVEGEGTINERDARRWFRRFRSGDMSLQNRPRTGRPLTTNTEALVNAVELNPQASTRVLATEVGASQSSIVRHLHRLGFKPRHPQMVPHELTPAQKTDITYDSA